ncbi:hypothetical protein, partial [Escherichia coli]|uniref:hypothetical protein n=1 Tax=Escherichia coli TaxID=562 RepID=UPI0020233755
NQESRLPPGSDFRRWVWITIAPFVTKDYKQRITDHQRLQLVYELKSRGFDGSEKEVDLLLRGGSIPSGAGLRIFYRNQRLQEDDQWRNLY